MYEHLLEPLEYYEKRGKAEHEANVTEYFEKLLAQSGVDEQQNRATVKAYHAECAAADKVARKIGTKKALRVLLIIAAVIGGILAIVGGVQLTADTGLGIGLLAGGLVLVALSIVLIVKVVNPRIRAAAEVLEKHREKAQKLLAEAEEQMAPLNALFDNTDTIRLMEKTIPDLDFEDCYSVQNETFLVECHDFYHPNGKNGSITNTLSGRLMGNPFLYIRRRICEIRDETYHGSLTISWTETYRDSKGNLQTRRRTQTLHASVQKPKPFYFSRTYLCYGNQAAPDLSFIRTPKHWERLSEKERERKIKRGQKELQEKAEKALQNGGHFQEMANEEFDVLFGATNRDHETQFRLMYTPLAQTNTVDILTSKAGYGDDFRFQKNHRLNIIESEHAQSWDMNTAASRYYSYDVDVARKNFISFNVDFFKSVFFDFAPLLSVPAYLEEPCASLEPPDDTLSNFTDYEHEVLANAVGGRNFAHRDSATEPILKTRLTSKAGADDMVSVTALSYSAHDRVDFVPRMGGDGRMHAVPVPWVEYLPLERTSHMRVSPAPVSERELRNSPLADAVCLHGMTARLE